MKMLVSDFDNTYYTNESDIKINNQAVEQFRKQGNIFAIATGRSYYDLNRVKKLYNLQYDYAILNHGATIIDNKGKIIDNSSINCEITPQLIKLLKINVSENYFCCSALESRVDIYHENLTKIHIRYKKEITARKVANKINKKFSKCLKVYVINKSAVEIISSHINKAIAITHITKNINKEDVYTIGDGINDLDMIKEYKGFKMSCGTELLNGIALGEVDNVHNLIEKIMV